jgi:hypothetical protein
MLRQKTFLKSIPWSTIISALCHLPLFLVLFVTTTSVLPDWIPGDAWYGACLIASIALAVFSGGIFRRAVRMELLDKGWLLGLLSFIGWAGLIWICLPENASQGWDIKSWLIPAGIVLFLYAASPQSWKTIAVCFVIVGLINSLGGFGIWVAHHFDPAYQSVISSDSEVVGTGRGWWYLIGGGVHPVAGLRGGVAINGMADVLFWPFMILVGCAGAVKRRWLAILGILAISLGIFVTYSRSTAIVMVIGVILFLFLQRKSGISISRRMIIAVLALIAMISTALLLLLPRSLVGSVFFRFEMWQQVFGYIQAFPNTLLGGGGFPRIVAHPYDVWDTHNMYLYLLVAYGIPGLLLFLAPIGHILWKGWKIFSGVRQHAIDPHAAAAISALACFLFRGMMESQVNEMDLRMAFVLFFVYAAATVRDELTKTASPTGSDSSRL